MTTTETKFWAVIRAKEERDLDGGYALHGWHLCGAGPASFGWAWVYPTGAKKWLGRTQAEVVKALRDAADLGLGVVVAPIPQDRDGGTEQVDLGLGDLGHGFSAP